MNLTKISNLLEFGLDSESLRPKGQNAFFVWLIVISAKAFSSIFSLASRSPYVVILCSCELCPLGASAPSFSYLQDPPL
jgi:hypothetical protein